ncbi:MAG: Nif3-like dinuclear metal center hexameric protein [Firmicutes bacterium]|nr:Nif3-like dinuclear metal center hexameric protein [Bacillota bacterium]
MAYTVQDFCNVMEELAPKKLAFEWDNVGLQVGAPKKQVKVVLVTLTLTHDVLELAIKRGVDLIICHHPVIFKPLSAIRTDLPQGRLIASLLQYDISVYVSHTNLDLAAPGLNDWLARDVGIENGKVLVPSTDPDVGLGRYGKIHSTTLGELAQQLESLWNSPCRIVGDPSQHVSKVAVVGGSGGDFINQAKRVGADVLITGDVSYHDAIDAEALGLAVLDAGHFSTEKVMVQEVTQYLRTKFGAEIEVISESSSNPFHF